MTPAEREEQDRRNTEYILDMFRRQYERGNDSIGLMSAIHWCARVGIPIPDWAASAFRRAVTPVLDLRCTSWDDAFGPPWKGRKVDRLQLERRFAIEVVVRVDGCRARGMTLDQALEHVVARHNARITDLNAKLTKSVAKKFYTKTAPSVNRAENAAAPSGKKSR
ncbi:MAG: hypothetical protein WEC00_13520 [Dongiaceae bacterium]